MVIMMEQLAYNINLYRNRKGWTQTELGHMLNVSRSVISKWENGFALPDAEALLKLSKAFHITADHLLGNPVYHDEILKDYRELYKLNNSFSENEEDALNLIHYVLSHTDFGKSVLKMSKLPLRKQTSLHEIFDTLVEYDQI